MDSIGWHIVWCPMSRKRVLGGRLPDRRAELTVENAAEGGWAIEALEIMPDRVHLGAPTPPGASLTHVSARAERSEFPDLQRALQTLSSKSSVVARVWRVWEATIHKSIDDETLRGKR